MSRLTLVAKFEDDEVDSGVEDGCSDCVTTSGGSSGSSSRDKANALSHGSQCVEDSDPLVVITAYANWLNNCASITTLDRTRIKSTGLGENLKEPDEAGGENSIRCDGSAPKDLKPVGGMGQRTSGPQFEADLEVFKRLTRALTILKAKSDGRSRQGESGSAPPTDRTQAIQTICSETMLSGLSSHPRAPAHVAKLLTYWHAQQKIPKVPSKDMYSLLLMTQHLERTALRLPSASTASVPILRPTDRSIQDNSLTRRCSTTGHFNEVIPHLQNVAECLLKLDDVLNDPRSKRSKEDLQSGVKYVKAATQVVDSATRVFRDRLGGARVPQHQA